MPLMHVNHPEGTFTPDDIDKLAMQFTNLGEDAEGIPKTPYLFSTTWVYFRPHAKQLVFHGGKSEGTNVIGIEVNVYEGGINAAKKKELIHEMTEAIADVLGLAKGERRPVYILIRDVPDINWGFYGDIITLDDLLKADPNEKPV